MLLPPPLPRCRAIVLGAGAPHAQVAATLRALVDDASVARPIEVFAEPPREIADAYQRADVRWHPPLADLRAAAASLANDDADLAWLVAGARLPTGGLHRLQAALHADPRVGTASPLCLADPMYSPLERGDRPPMGQAALDGWLESHAAREPIELPAPLAACGIVRAGALAALDASAGVPGAPWPLLLTRAGWLHVACARVLVDTAGTTPNGRAAAQAAGEHDISLLSDRRYWRDAHPLTGLRWKLARAAGGDPTSARPGPVPARAEPSAIRLHIAHSWGGGLSTWVSDFCDGDEGAENLVLRSIGVVGAYGQRLALYRGSERTEPLRIWELGLPIHATAIAHLQYRSVLREIAADFGIDSVLVSSLIGHSLDAMRTGLPTLLVTHDHYPFCVAIFAFHAGECRSCDRARLDDCIARNPGHRFFRGVASEDWVALRAAFCATVRDEGVTLVAPAASVRERWRALMPALADARFEVVPHGVSLPPAVAFEPPRDGPLRLIKLGRLSMEKGGALLEELVPEIAGFAHLTLLGCGNDAARFGRWAGVTAVADFARDELPGLIARARPHLGLQLSVVPETFGYTLSELWHCGVPVLASRVGSLADRVREGETGFLTETTPAAVLARLREIAAARNRLDEMRARLLDEPVRTNAQMVADYRALLPAGRRMRALQRNSDSFLDANLQSPTQRIAVGPISVDPELTYLHAARAFLRYTLGKAAHSPRLPRAIRRLLGGS